jgi:hypothetical protein
MSDLLPYQRELVAYLRSLSVQDPPAPWRLVQFVRLGGVYGVGYGESSDLLMVVSSAGRGVFDCFTGDKVARDYDENIEAWYSEDGLSAEGIGPLLGSSVAIAGIYGGGLRLMTSDRWEMELVSPNWPNSFLLLRPPWRAGMDDWKDALKIAPRAGDDDIVAYGFSPTGLSFVCVTSSGADLFARNEP